MKNQRMLGTVCPWFSGYGFTLYWGSCNFPSSFRPSRGRFSSVYLRSSGEIEEKYLYKGPGRYFPRQCSKE